MEKIVSMTWFMGGIELSIFGGTRTELKDLSYVPIFSSTNFNVHSKKGCNRLQVYGKFADYDFHAYYNEPYSTGLEETLKSLSNEEGENYLKYEMLRLMLVAAEEKDHADIKYIQRKFVSMIPFLSTYEPELLIRLSNTIGYKAVMANVCNNSLQAEGERNHITNILVETAYLTEKKVRREIGDTINKIIHGEKLV